MPSLIEEIKQTAATEEEKRAAIREEIVSFFREYLNSEEFTETIKSWCKSAIRNGNNHESVEVEFWDYHDGCSATHFGVGTKEWRNPKESSGWGSRTYKGVGLYQLQEDVGPRLTEMTKSKLIELGFNVSVQDKRGRIGYYHTAITLSW